MVLEMLQLLVEQPQTLFRHLVGLDVVDADLQKVEARGVQLLDPFREEKITVGDQTGHHAEPADMADQIIEIRMEHRFAAAEGDNRRSKRLERIDTAE